MRFCAKLVVLLGIVLLAACAAGCDSGGGDGDEGPGEQGGFEGTWEQVGCANADSCLDVDCISGWEKWRRKIEFVDGGKTVKMWLGPDPGKTAYMKDDKICTPLGDAPAATDMCFPLEWCGDFLLYCLVPELCEKLSRVD
ncbi:MAG: hypothetical protein FJ109_10405 [Deltaproteobacteria bacterium]|nr:hypothetical protein [Deltaproteobacteria bacterium]